MTATIKEVPVYGDVVEINTIDILDRLTNFGIDDQDALQIIRGLIADSLDMDELYYEKYYA